MDNWSLNQNIWNMNNYWSLFFFVFSKPKFDEKADPQESLMGMMKQMYDEGDDEMKRTIRKAWYESQAKKGNKLTDDTLEDY